MIDPEQLERGLSVGGAQVVVLGQRAGPHVTLSSYGSRIVSLVVPDAAGNLVDVVLGYRDLATYVSDVRSYFGATIGRFANRIADARFVINGAERRLSNNEGATALHGGLEGFDRRIWSIDGVAGSTARLSLGSPDGDQGFPGNLAVEVAFTLDVERDVSHLRIDYTARTDALTVVNLTNHAYFNLAGEGAGTIDDHTLQVAAAHVLPVDDRLIPTGESLPVENSPFDFRQPQAIGAHRGDPRLAASGGYDHTYVLDDGVAAAPREVAVLFCPRSGVKMTVRTTEPGLQVYGGQQLATGGVGKSGSIYGPGSGLCLETQHFPDSPNRPEFPSTTLRPGEAYRSSTIYSFGVRVE